MHGKADLSSPEDVAEHQRQLLHRCHLVPFSARLCTGVAAFDPASSPSGDLSPFPSSPARSRLFSLVDHACHQPAEYRVVTLASLARSRQVQLWASGLVAAGVAIGAVLAYLRLSVQRGRIMKAA